MATKTHSQDPIGHIPDAHTPSRVLSDALPLILHSGCPQQAYAPREMVGLFQQGVFLRTWQTLRYDCDTEVGFEKGKPVR